MKRVANHIGAMMLILIAAAVTQTNAQHAHPTTAAGPLRPALVDSLRRVHRAEPRLVAFINFIDSLGHANNNIAEARAVELLEQRAAMFRGAQQRRNIETRGWPVIGDPAAPVTLVVYYSITCPVCKSNFIELHAAITQGALRGRARMIAKPFSTHIGDRALIAAHDMGRFADYKLALSRVPGRLDENAIYNTAASLYFDRDRFRTMVENPALLRRVEQSIAEATSFGLTHVPTYFINGAQYESIGAPRWLIDAVERAAESQ